MTKANNLIVCPRCKGKGQLTIYEQDQWTTERCKLCWGTGQTTQQKLEEYKQAQQIGCIAMIILIFVAIFYLGRGQVVIPPPPNIVPSTPIHATSQPKSCPVPINVPQTRFNIQFTIQKIKSEADALVLEILIVRKPSEKPLLWYGDKPPFDGIYLKTSRGIFKAKGVGGVFKNEKTVIQDNGSYEGSISFPKISDKQAVFHYPDMGTACLNLN